MRFLGLIFFLLLAGCQSNQQPSSQIGENSQALAAHGAMDGTGISETANILKGKVLERIDADRYSYLRLSVESGETWAAVLQADVQVGDEVTIPNPMPMDGFESKTLNRKFERIMFGVLAESEDTQRMIMDAHSAVTEAVDIGSIRVDKASGPGGRTILEIFAEKNDLKDRKVAVRGKVTKVNANILGKTWIHIQDGTGDSQSKTNDLVVTSQDSPAVGDTILVEGVLRTDKNYGMGYVFPVVIEDAKVTKQ